MARVRTVRGDISPIDVGITLCHEHILVDLRFNCHIWAPQEATLRALMEKPVTMDMIGLLRRGVWRFNRDDLHLSEIDPAVEELMEFRSFGGKTLVEQTLPGIGRDPVGLRRVSELTNLNIICSTGWYTILTHPPYVKRKSAEELAEIMVKEIEEGIDGSNVRAGVIGECACSFEGDTPYHEDEKKVLKAACKAQKATGVAFTCHPAIFDLNKKIFRSDAPKSYIRLIEEEGASLEKFFLSHSDLVCPTTDHASNLLDRGITLSFDHFGFEMTWNYNLPSVRFPTDPEVISKVVELCKEGYEKQIILSHDICLKHLLKKYGGSGYSHILEHIVPILRHHGVREKQIRAMLIDNPKKLLSF